MQIRFRFDVVCPYAWLASTCIERLAAAHGASVSWEPVLLGGIYRALGVGDEPTAARSEARNRADWVDRQRLAELMGVTLRPHPKHPRRTVHALRLILAAPTADRQHVARSLFEAYHLHHEDISDPTVLARVATRHGLDPRCMHSDELRSELRRVTDEAVADGLFGVPSFDVGSRLYFGVDRLPLVVRALGGSAVEHAPVTGGAEGEVIEFFHDVASPYAYLASTQVQRIAARHGAAIRWVPVLLGALFRDIGTADVPLLTMSAPRQAYISRDLHDWAEYWGVPFAFAPQFPVRSVTAQRVTIVDPDTIPALYEATWAQQREIASPEVLAEVLDQAGFAGKRLVGATQAPEVKAQLRANTARAQSLGICGVPTARFRDRLYWGQDRLFHLDAALGGWQPEV